MLGSLMLKKLKRKRVYSKVSSCQKMGLVPVIKFHHCGVLNLGD